MTYPVLSDVKTFLNISGTGEDARLTLALDAAKSFIERATYRVFVASEIQLPFQTIASSGRILAFHRDCVSISNVLNGDGLAVTQYHTMPQEAPFYAIELDWDVATPFHIGADGTLPLVTAYWGFSTACPDDVFYAILVHTQQLYDIPRQAGGGEIGFRASSGVGVQPGTLHYLVDEVIRKYRRWR